jgi:hypothetical protein
MITMRGKSTIDTPMLSRGKRLAHPGSAPRAILRRVGRIHLDYHTAGAFSLARQDRSELTPPGVTDAFGQMMISHHPFDVQIFDGDRVELPHDLERRLVMEIRPLPSYLLMLLLMQFDGLAPAITSLVRTARDSALSGLEFFFRRPVALRILNRLARRKSGEVFNPDIDSNRVSRLREEAGLVFFDGEDDIPTVCFSLNRAGFDCPFHPTGEANAARADFGQMELVAFEPETAFHLRKGKTVEAVFPLEARIPRIFSRFYATKEGVESLAQSPQSVLKNLGVDPGNVLSNVFDFWKLDGLSMVIDRKPIHLVGVAAFLKSSVVEFAATIKPPIENGFDPLRRFDFKLVCLHAKAILQRYFRCARDNRAGSPRDAKFISTQTSKTRCGWSTLSQKDSNGARIWP